MADLDALMAELEGVQNNLGNGGGGGGLSAVTVGSTTTTSALPVVVVGAATMGGGGGPTSTSSLSLSSDQLEPLVWYQVLQHPLFQKEGAESGMVVEDQGREMYLAALSRIEQEEDEEESGSLLKDLHLTMSRPTESIARAISKIQRNPYDRDAWKSVLSETSAETLVQYRPIWRVFKGLFPRSGSQLAKYAQQEIDDLKNNYRENLDLKLLGTLRLCNLFRKHLPVGMSVELYKVFIAWLRGGQLASTGAIHAAALSGQSNSRMQASWGTFPELVVEDAFKKALSDVGRLVGSTWIWRDFIDYQPSREVGIKRSIYQFVLAMPVDDLEEIRGAYDRFEQASSARRVKLQEKLEKTFSRTQKVLYPQRKKLYEQLDVDGFIPRPLIHPDGGVVGGGKWRVGGMTEQDDIFHYQVWENIIAFEKRTEMQGAPITDKEQIKRIGCALKERLCYFPFDIACWLEALEWFQDRNEQREVRSLVDQLLKHAPSRRCAVDNSSSADNIMVPLLPLFIFADYLGMEIKSGGSKQQQQDSSSSSSGATSADTTTANAIRTAFQLFDRMMNSTKSSLTELMTSAQETVSKIVEDNDPTSSSSSSSIIVIPTSLFQTFEGLVNHCKDLVLTHCTMMRWVRLTLLGPRGVAASRLAAQRALRPSHKGDTSVMISFISNTAKQLGNLYTAGRSSGGGSLGGSSANRLSQADAARVEKLAQRTLSLLNPFFTYWIDIELNFNRNSTNNNSISVPGEAQATLDEGSSAALSVFHGWTSYISDAILPNVPKSWSAIHCGCDSTINRMAHKLISMFPSKKDQIDSRLSLFESRVKERLPLEELWLSDAQTRLFAGSFKHADALGSSLRLGNLRNPPSGPVDVKNFVQRKSEIYSGLDPFTDHQRHLQREQQLTIGGGPLDGGAAGRTVSEMPIILHLGGKGGGATSSSHYFVAIKGKPEISRWNKFVMPENTIQKGKEANQQSRQQRGMFRQQQQQRNPQQPGGVGGAMKRPPQKTHQDLSDAELAKLLGITDSGDGEDALLDGEGNNSIEAAKKKEEQWKFSSSGSAKNGSIDHPSSVNAALSRNMFGGAIIKSKALAEEAEVNNRAGGDKAGGDEEFDAAPGHTGGGRHGRPVFQCMGRAWVPDMMSDLPRSTLRVALNSSNNSSSTTAATADVPHNKKQRIEGGGGGGGGRSHGPAKFANNNNGSTTQHKTLPALGRFLEQLPSRHACEGRFPPFLPSCNPHIKAKMEELENSFSTADVADESAFESAMEPYRQVLADEEEGRCETLLLRPDGKYLRPQQQLARSSSFDPEAEQPNPQTLEEAIYENDDESSNGIHQLKFQPDSVWLVEQLRGVEEPIVPPVSATADGASGVV